MPKMTLKIPKLGVSMQEGTVVEWKVATGDAVGLGDHIYTVESEKASYEVQSPFAGTITVLAAAGDTLKVGTPIAEIQT